MFPDGRGLGHQRPCSVVRLGRLLVFFWAQHLVGNPAAAEGSGATRASRFEVFVNLCVFSFQLVAKVGSITAQSVAKQSGEMIGRGFSAGLRPLSHGRAQGDVSDQSRPGQPPSGEGKIALPTHPYGTHARATTGTQGLRVTSRKGCGNQAGSSTGLRNISKRRHEIVGSPIRRRRKNHFPNHGESINVGPALIVPAATCIKHVCFLNVISYGI